MTCRRRSNGSNPDLELKLEVCGPFPDGEADGLSPSPPRSCVSVELEVDGLEFRNLGKQPDGKSMVLAGCQRCLMYVMLSGDRLRCPKCESTAVFLIDDLKDHAAEGTAGSRVNGTTKALSEQDFFMD
ncbi:hypothetical protein MLD38_032475 [Melastoma candidum]|uniref:Uncharacterized protein n=1 Tax=Melastoma candidum TaxID=119954 RepID=A0ACB9M3N6_9MYRT|nr:hypothetical protein MLD38_032475 [Melastoma candidum]